MEIQLELRSRGINSDKIAVILNGVDLGVYQQKEKDAELMNQYKLKNKFVVAYVGTHGMAHKLETIVESAERMASNRSVLFLLCWWWGTGRRNKKVQSKLRG